MGLPVGCRSWLSDGETYESIMTNLQPIDLNDVAQYWKSRGLVAERHLPYYVRWLQRFLVGPGGDPSLSPGDAQRAFVGQLELEQIPEWQVGQAARAVELYQKHFRWIRWARPTANSSTLSGKCAWHRCRLGQPGRPGRVEN